MSNNQLNNNNNNKDPKRKNRQGWGAVIATALLTALVVLLLYQFRQDSQYQEITYSKFLSLVDEGFVDKVQLDTQKMEIQLKDNAWLDRKGNLQYTNDEKQIARNKRNKVTYYTGIVKDDTLSDRLYKAGVEYGQKIPDSTSLSLIHI